MQSKSSSVGSYPSFFLQAGAGAGKTKTLIDTFVDFVKSYRKQNQGVFPKVVMTTFTRKATQEVKERLQRRVLQENEPDFFEYVNQKSKVHISTIHSILTMFLSQNGHLIQLSSDFKIIAANEIEKNKKKCLRQILNQDAELQVLLEDYLFTELIEMLSDWEEQCSVEVKAERISATDFRDETIKFISAFLQKTQQLSQMIPGATKNAQWLEHAQALGRLHCEVEVDEKIEAFIDLILELEENLTMPRKDKRIIHEDCLAVYQQFMADYWKPLSNEKTAAQFRPSYWSKHEKRSQLFARLCLMYKEKFDQLKSQANFLSMSDLELKSLEILRAYPEAGVLFSQDWHYWMVDEYQDTSPRQVELLRHFIGASPQFIVGDPQQSIYYFRGARSEVFLNKKNEMQEQGAQVEVRTDNYRTRAPVLSFINWLFCQRPQFGAMTPRSSLASDDEYPAMELRYLEENDEDDICAEAVIEKIQSLLAAGAAPESICVLAQKNSSLQKVQHLARQYKVPAQLRSAGQFFDRREIQDVTSFLIFLSNPHDNINFVSLLRSPWFYMTDEMISDLCQLSKISFWFAALNSPLFSQEKVILKLKDFLEESERQGYLEMLRKFYSESGILDSCAYADPSGRREANLWKLMSLFQRAQMSPGFNILQFLREFSEELSAEEGHSESDATPAFQPQQVQLMTVHASKGLEFDHVIITHAHQSRGNEYTSLFEYSATENKWTLAEKSDLGEKYPSLLSTRFKLERIERLDQENERLLYVAMTRAKKSLTVIGKKSRTENQSWLSLIPIPKIDDVINFDGFKVCVSTQKPVLQTPQPVSLADQKIRNPWQNQSKKETYKKASVTGLVDLFSVSQLNKTSSEEDNNEHFQKPEALVSGLQVARYGTEMHAVFESLKYSGGTALMVRKEVEWLLTLEKPPIKQLINSGHVEWGFTLRAQGIQLQGQIDLWAEHEGQLWIVDYKTGSTQYSQKAIDQMKIYAWALRQMRQSQSARANLVAVYPLEQKVVLQEVFFNHTFEEQLQTLITEYIQD